jgi:hypothetical protein
MADTISASKAPFKEVSVIAPASLPSYEVDPLECPRCGTLTRVIALTEKPDIIERIPNYLDRWRQSYRPVIWANGSFSVWRGTNFSSHRASGIRRQPPFEPDQI